MRYRLGLDLGTNSIGWSVYSLNEENEIVDLENLGVRIFSDGRDPQTKEPLAVARRTARGQRRIIRRRKSRRKATFRLLQSQGLFPSVKEENQKLKLLNPYELRIKALDDKLEPFELGRVLFNLSVRRGFKSNRKDGSQEEEKENSKSSKLSQTDKCNNLAKAIKESGYRTLGEFLWKKQRENGGLRFAPDRMEFYPTRQLYIDEFNLIRQKQEEFYPDIEWDLIFDSIFFQRPLRPQERGKCQYMPEKERTFKAMPCAQQIRILQDVYNLTITESGKIKQLLPEWQEKLITLLNSKDKVTFADMKKKLDLRDDIVFNLESDVRDHLQGNSTSVKMRSKNRFGKMWDSFSLQEQDDIIENLITAEEDSEVLEMLKKYNLTDEQNEYIVKKTQFAAGTTSFCREFTEQVVAEIQKEKCQIHVAIENLGYKYAEQAVEKFDYLPYYGEVLVGSTMGIRSEPKNVEEKYGKISNPTVHVALNQTKTVVNALVKEYGKPEQIVIEVSRDLKNSREAKIAIQKQIKANQKENERLNTKIKDANSSILFPNRTDRLKYKLWEELNPSNAAERGCIYCGKQISGADIFSDNIQIEHILPFGRTLWDSEHNKTVAHVKCNQFKGDRSPFEAFGNSPAGFNWSAILERSSLLKDPQKKRLFSEKAMETFEKDSGFIARQLTDNAYLSRMALRYLKAIINSKDTNVWAVSGGMTKLLRDKWEIDNILKRKINKEEIAHFSLKDEQIGNYKKNRYDHRHHALDAAVIALIDRSLVQEISNKNRQHKKNSINCPELPILKFDLIEKTKQIIVSYKPDHGAQGKLSKETLLGKIKCPEQVAISEIKTEADIDSIRNDRVRAEFRSTFEKTGDIKKTIKELKDIYPVICVYKEYYVSRAYVTSLNEKNIDSVIDPVIREKIRVFSEEHKEIKFDKRMELFSRETGIKKVRCKNNDQTPIEITNCDDTVRYLCTEDYFAAVIWEIPAGKEGKKSTFKAVYLRRDEIDENNLPKKECKPHPAAKKIGILHKNDYVEFSDGGKWYKARIAGYSASNNKIDYRPIYSSSDCKDWIISTADDMSEECWKEISRQNYISVNKLFGEKDARLITVNPIGRVFRK